MKILVTGFNPFDGEDMNPSYQAVSRLPGKIAGAEISTLEVPTEFGRSLEVVLGAVQALRPDAVVCVGQAGGRSAITPERVAINLQDATISDNAGVQPADAPVVAGGPAAYFSPLPVKDMAAAIRAAGIPAAVSLSAGSFVCNQLLYGLLHHGLYAGFIHVPYSPQQVVDKPGKPAMSVSDIAQALVAALEIVAIQFMDQKDRPAGVKS